MIKIFYVDSYQVEVPQKHRFPVDKFRLIREQLLETKVVDGEMLYKAPLATKEAILLAHTSEYYQAIYTGSIDDKAMRRIGFPWSQSLVNRSLATIGATLESAQHAICHCFSGVLGGGYHHAFADRGEGYCLFNDVAIAILHLYNQGLIQRAAIIDLDVHQGNGNSAILSSESNVFIFSMHGARNYPLRKVSSTIDIDLPDFTEDKEYLILLEKYLPQVFDFRPDIVFYQAGVDPLKEDTLGRLSLSLEGLAQRDRLVLSHCKKHNIPVVINIGGGYSKPIELSVAAHVQTYGVAREIYW